MSKRMTVRRNTQRMLWAESIGHCMNPECQDELIQNGSNNGEMAHIRPHADGGNVSFENLILLCRNCHKKIDESRMEATIARLRSWKKGRNNAIKGYFEKRYVSFQALEHAVTPLLERNGQIFHSYGPTSDDPHMSGRRALWLKFEGEIISNNRRLELILTNNKHLLHRENREFVTLFVAHVREFIETRDDSEIIRICLFPQELLSIFGIEEVADSWPPNLSALQNFVSHLIREERFVSLSISPETSVTYSDKGEIVTLMLSDRPRIQQIFWNGKFYIPQTTNVRIGDLVFFVQWLDKNKIAYEFPNKGDLTELVLNRKYKVKLCYEYVLSLSEIHAMDLTEGDTVINLHNWNNGPISKDANEYASSIGVRLFNQNDFFKFAHRNIK